MDERRQISIERKIVIGSIIDSEYLKYAYSVIDPGQCASDYARTLLTWIFDFWAEFKFAPKKKIQDIYEKNLDKGRVTSDDGEIIEDLLESLSDEQQNWNEDELDYLLTITLEYANAAKVRNLFERGTDALDNGDLEEALSDIQNFKVISRNRTEIVIPLSTDEQKKAVFGSAMEPIFTYPGALGELLNPHLYKGGFLVFLAQNKGGKSFYLTDAAMRAGEQGKRVLIYQAGDMDQVQAERRMAIYSAKKSNLQRYCSPLLIPTPDCIYNQNGECELHHWINKDEEIFPFDGRTEKFFYEELGSKHMRETFEDFRTHKICIECIRPGNERFKNKFRGTVWWKRRGKVDPLDLGEYNQLERQGLQRFFTPYKGLRNIRMTTSSNESLTVAMINADLKILRDEEDWTPEVLLIDYMDLLAPDLDTLRLSGRDQENKKWQRTRRLSQEWSDMLVLSASQSDAQGFDKVLLDRQNYSEDRRKLDHVTGMIGINMSNDEKLMGLARLNEVISRETDGTKIVKVLHRLEIGRPVLYSFY